ncbi:MAG: 4-hydroxy-tetrahydrodipicolinate reductase [Planctomycetota bacterium]|nr:4-hydroxy-tetrahydrodipicolinate reductase [Planctomycetota bacterium]
MINVSIFGAAGRMGKRLIDLASSDEQLSLVGAVEATGHPLLGQDAGTVAGIGPLGLPLTSELPKGPQVVIDFSQAEAVDGILQTCLAANVPIVIATTGFGPETAERIESASRSLPIVWSPNMSLAVNLTMKLSEIAAAALQDSGNRADVEIIETHHRFKADAPSGTALKFGELIADQLGIDHHQHGRQGTTGERPANEIGYHAVRSGDDAGQHTILFGMMGEKIELRVAASNRDCYALGAISAAKFISDQPAGMYSMYDVLGLN